MSCIHARVFDNAVNQLLVETVFVRRFSLLSVANTFSFAVCASTRGRRRRRQPGRPAGRHEDEEQADFVAADSERRERLRRFGRGQRQAQQRRVGERSAADGRGADQERDAAATGAVGHGQAGPWRGRRRNGGERRGHSRW